MSELDELRQRAERAEAERDKLAATLALIAEGEGQDERVYVETIAGPTVNLVSDKPDPSERVPKNLRKPCNKAGEKEAAWLKEHGMRAEGV